MKELYLLSAFGFVLALFFSSCGEQTRKLDTASPSRKQIGKKANPTGFIHCAYEDQNKDLWFGTIEHGVYKYDGTSFTHYTEADGLPNNKVSCIYQHENGDMWFGTVDGVSIFDGEHFSHLKIPQQERSTEWLKQVFPIVNPNEVQSINQDKSGAIWLGTNGAGAYHFDGENFTNHLADIGNKMPDSLYHNIIQSITKDRDGNLWFSSMSHGGISRFNGSTFDHFLPEDGIADDMVRLSHLDHEGHLWIGFNGNRESGLTHYNGDSFMTYSTEDGLCSKNVRGIHEDQDGILWLGGMQGFCSFDGDTFTELVGPSNETYDRIVFVIVDQNNHVWFGGNNGFWRYNRITVEDMKAN